MLRRFDKSGDGGYVHHMQTLFSMTVCIEA